MKRGEVWLINLDPTIGAEIKKSRPAIIVNDDAIGILPLKVIVPVTEWKEHYAAAPWLVRLLPDGEKETFSSRCVPGPLGFPEKIRPASGKTF